jgi:hypothetical protein
MNWHPYRLAIVFLMANFAACGQAPKRGEEFPGYLKTAIPSLKTP